MTKTFIISLITLALVAALIVLAVVFLPGLGAAPPASSAAAAAQDDVIAVYGQGKVSIQPDVAYVTLGVNTMHADPQKAMDDNAQRMDAVMTALESAGIESSDIQTNDYSVYQRMDYQNGKETPLGYEVTNTVKVTINDVDKAGSVIAAASAAGANRFHGIRFDVLDREAAYSDALDLALERAEQKAQQLAKSTGRSVSGVISMQEGGTTASPYMPTLTNYAMDAAPMADMASGSAVSSGSMEITALVNVVYRLN